MGKGIGGLKPPDSSIRPSQLTLGMSAGPIAGAKNHRGIRCLNTKLTAFRGLQIDLASGRLSVMAPVAAR